MGSDDRQTVEVTNPILGSLKASGANLNLIFTVGTFVFVAIMAWVISTHAVEAKDEAKTVAQALKESQAEVAKALREVSRENAELFKAFATEQRNMTQEIRRGHEFQRETACLLDPALKNRPDARDVCRRLGRVDR